MLRPYFFCLAFLLVPWVAGAQPEGPVPLGLVVFGDDLPREAVRSGLARELGRPVVLAEAGARSAGPFVTVTWKKERSELAVAYDEPGRGTVSRVVRARATAAENVQDAIVLGASLARNEADELLGKPAPPPPPHEEPKTEPPPPAAAAPLPLPEPAKRDFVPAYAAIFHPLATNFDRPYARTHFGFNLFYGRAGELDNGVQLGLVNVVQGKEGVASGDMSGFQFAPIFGANYASGHATGFQWAWLGNAAGRGVDGAQIGGLANVSVGNANGFQGTLGVNVSTGNVEGVQLASINVARDVTGAQLGFVNVARKVDGVMLGLVNVADDIDGVPIGVVSVTRTGGVHPVVWGGTDTYANVGLKFATKHTYTMVAAHYTALGEINTTTDGGRAIHADAHDAFGGGFFVGGHIPIESAFVDIDLGFSSLGSPHRSIQTMTDGSLHGYHEVDLESRLRALVGYSFAPHASLFFGVGGTVRARIIDQGRDAVVQPLADIFGGVQF